MIVKVHVFRAKVLGWDDKYDDILFAVSHFSKEEAESCFVEKIGFTSKNNSEYPYTYYEYEGKDYYDYHYIGIEDRDVDNCEVF